jgi:hypothetical protein
VDRYNLAVTDGRLDLLCCRGGTRRHGPVVSGHVIEIVYAELLGNRASDPFSQVRIEGDLLSVEVLINGGLLIIDRAFKFVRRLYFSQTDVSSSATRTSGWQRRYDPKISVNGPLGETGRFPQTLSAGRMTQKAFPWPVVSVSGHLSPACWPSAGTAQFSANRSAPPILTNATHIPSAGFSQGFAFVVLTEPGQRQLFWETTSGPEWRGESGSVPLTGRPVVIVPLSHKQAYLDRYALPDKIHTPLSNEEHWPVPY